MNILVYIKEERERLLVIQHIRMILKLAYNI